METFDVEVYKQRPEIIRQTVQQIQKDFGMFGMDIHFTGNTEMAYNEMFVQLLDHISNLMNLNYQKLSSLLYQIDLSENKIIEAEIKHPQWTRNEIITELVIHRELKKVLIRNYFKNNPDKL